MSPYTRWDSDEVESFYEKYIKSDFDPWYFPSYRYLINKGYIGFYTALYFGKTKKYPDIDSFCKEYWLKRLTTRKVKWTPEFIESFYNEKIVPFIEDNYLPTSDWFKEKWWEYWGFITVLNLWKIKWYDNIKDFKIKKWLNVIRRKRNYNKEEVDNFYLEKIFKHIKNNKIPNQKWFYDRGWDFLIWYRSVNNCESGYKWLKDFSIKNNLIFPEKKLWTKEAVEDFYKVNIKPLMDWNIFLPYSRFKELWWKYLEFYNALRNKRVNEYSWIKDFKKRNKLK